MSGSNTYYNAGNVGIGTASPTVSLEVAGLARITGTGGFSIGEDAAQNRIRTISGSRFAFYNSSDVLTGLAIRSIGVGATFGTIATPTNGAIIEGNVGIGTSSPALALDVIGTTSGSLRLSADAADAANKLGRIVGRPYTNANANFMAFDIRGLATTNEINYGGGSGILNAVTTHRFFTAADNNTLSGTERMVLDSSGNLAVDTNTLYVDATNNRVGIGTASPGYELQVIGSAAVKDNLLLQRSGSSLYLTVARYWDGTGLPLTTGPRGDIVAIGNQGGDPVAFVTGNTERMRLDASGNVGIGTTSPSQRLDVSGSVNVRSASPTVFFDRNGSYTWRIANGDGTTYPLSSFNIANNAGTAAITVTAANRVGIGTTSPVTALDVRGVLGSSFSGNVYSTIDGNTDGNMYLTANAGAANTTASNIIFRGSTSGSAVVERMRIASDGVVSIGGNTVLHAGNYSSYSTFGGKVISGGNNGFANDVYYVGVRNPIWSFGNASSYGISYYQGAAGIGGVDTIGFSVNGTTSATSNNFAIAPGASYVNNNVILHAGNYTSYSPTLTGTGASGTWGINVTGTSGSISGYNNPTTADTPNTIAYRNGNGDIVVREITLNSGLSTQTPTVLASIYPTTNQLVRTTPAAVSEAIRTAASGTWGISITGNLTATSPTLGYSLSGQDISYGYQGGPQVLSQGNGAAMMSFHRPGLYAINFGLGTDNQLRTGGWSRGGNHVILDSGNYSSYAPSLTGSGASGTWGINISGNSATTAGCTFSNDSAYKDDITTRTDSGFWQSSTGTTAEGWPRNDNTWQHLLSVTHSNDSNYYAMQLSAGFYSQNLYYRSTNGSGTTGWSEILTSSSYSSYTLPLSGGTLSGQLNMSGGALINAPNGFISNGNPWSTANSAFFPNGITTAGGTNWVYGTTYIGNAPGNGTGCEVSSNGRIFNTVSSGTAMHVRRTGSAGTATDSYTALFEQTYGNHSWGIVSEYRIGNSGGSDRPSILFSTAYNSNTWSVGFGSGSDDNFRINRDHGHRNSSWGTTLMVMDRSGNVTYTGNVTAFSDLRLKDNIERIAGALAKVRRLRGVTFTRIDQEDKERRHAGVIAQEIEAEHPEVVYEDASGTKHVAYGNSIGLLIEAIKELADMVEELR